MQNFFNTILDYLLNVVITTFSQLFILFGPLLILAFIMNYVAGQVEKNSYRVLGRNTYLYVFGWLGTAVHEIGHAVFAIIFGHRIKEIKLFTPNSGSSLGHVSHAYNPNSFYQTFGNFFIGIGPILMGSIVLYIATYYLFGININDFSSVNISSSSFTDFSSLGVLVQSVWGSCVAFAGYIFSNIAIHWWKMLIFLYLLFSVGSSITLSPPDIEGALSGFVIFVVLLVLFNLVTLWVGDFASVAFSYASAYFAGFYFLIAFSIIVNTVFVVFLYIIKSIKSR